MEIPHFRRSMFEDCNIYPVIFKYFPHLLEDLRSEYTNNVDVSFNPSANNLDQLFYWADTSQGHEFWDEEHEDYCDLCRKSEL